MLFLLGFWLFTGSRGGFGLLFVGLQRFVFFVMVRRQRRSTRFTEETDFRSRAMAFCGLGGFLGCRLLVEKKQKAYLVVNKTEGTKTTNK